MTKQSRESLYSFLLLLAGIGFGLIVLFLAMGCCHECPPPYPVVVNRPCQLPPEVTLPTAAPLAKCGPGELVCFDLANAKNLALREARMKQWIKEARTLCTPTMLVPTSQPASSTIHR